jgi:hypothetical protein
MSYDSDVNNLALLEESIEYDPSAELNPTLKVPDGTYLSELSLGKFGIEVNAPRSGGKPYLNVHVQAKIIQPGDRYDGFRVSGFIKTTDFGNGATPVHEMLKSCGSAAPAQQKLKDLWVLVESTLAGTPQCKVRTRWEASTKNSSGADSEYLRIRGMKNFPILANGSYSPFKTVTLDDGSEVQVEARETIVDFQPASQGTATASY